MLSPQAVRELHDSWLPNITNTGLNRLIDLLEKRSPLLIHGCFTRAIPQGCLASHIAWHHPQTRHQTVEAGITWLHHVAGLNPATSHVLRDWDRKGMSDWEIRADLLDLFRREREERSVRAAEEIHEDSSSRLLEVYEGSVSACRPGS